MQNEQDRYKETIRTWDSLSELYAEKFRDVELYNHTYEKLVSYVRNSSANILEIGCGPGVVSGHLLRLKPGLQILATDVSQSMVNLAQKMYPALNTQVLDIREIGGLNQSFSAIVAAFVVPYITPIDFETFVCNSYLKLEGNGVLYVSFVPGDLRKSGFLTGSTGLRTYFHYYPESYVLEVLINSGFDVLETFHLQYPKSLNEVELHTVMIARVNDK